MANADKYPRVSIILPTHNRAHYIMHTIESVCNQTYQNWELLVIDDGSDDDTVGLVKQIKDERVQLHETTTRLGIAGTRNEGLSKASGELIAFIDSDDLWAPEKLEKQVTTIQQYPDAGFSLTGGYDFTTVGEPISFFYKQREGLKYGNIFLAFFQSEAAATMPSLMLRKECLPIAGIFEETAPIDFFLKLASQFNAVILYEPLFYRRVHDTNYSILNRLKRHREGIKTIRSYKKSLPLQIFRDSLFKSYVNFGEKCLLYKEPREAINNFFQAWRQKPFSIIPLKKTGKAILQYFNR